MSRSQLTSTVEQNTCGAVSPYVEGKNLIINGAMEIAQRGTSITGGSTNTYGLDRWFTTGYGLGTAFNIAQGTASPPSGFRYYQSITQSTATSTNVTVSQFLETTDVLRMAGKTVTLSYMYKIPTSATTAWTVAAYYSTATDGNLAPYNSRTGIISSTITNNTAWTTGTTVTFTVPSNATSFCIEFSNYNSTVNGANFQFTGVQLEIGSIATPFSRAGGTFSGELAACQRYYYRITPNGVANATIGYGLAASTTNMLMNIAVPVSMRVNPTALDSSGVDIRTGAGGSPGTFSNIYIETTQCGNQQLAITAIVTSGLTTNTGYYVRTTSSAGYVGFSAEL